MNNRAIKILFRLPALIIAIGIFSLSAQSVLPQPKGIFGWDKFQHLLAYASLSFCAGFWFSTQDWKAKPVFALLITIAVSILYGLSDEIHQYFTPGRDCNIFDLLADSLGALIGAFLCLLMKGKVIRRNIP
ncbi:MAG: VanZ family protein [Spirochaetaceae bacterium]|jgi:VanZ family protein|nr:VanZ family protein [Spirochaetaceae bacterium]